MCGLTKFSQHTFGQTVTVKTDHKPLIGLLSKPIAECSSRVQHMRFHLQQFDFNLVYKPGKELFIADTQHSADRHSLNCIRTTHIGLLGASAHDTKPGHASPNN